jgi:hypothetical protein
VGSEGVCCSWRRTWISKQRERERQADAETWCAAKTMIWEKRWRWRQGCSRHWTLVAKREGYMKLARRKLAEEQSSPLGRRNGSMFGRWRGSARRGRRKLQDVARADKQRKSCELPWSALLRDIAAGFAGSAGMRTEHRIDGEPGSDVRGRRRQRD